MRGIILRIGALVAWLRGRPRKVTVPVRLLLLALVSFGAYQAADAYNYMQNNPTFCRACHTMQEAWDRWQTSEHRSVNCHDCHHTTIVEGAMLLAKFSFSQPENVGKHAVIQDEACERCHESGNSRWVQVASTAGHRVHAEERNIACVKCHSVTLHRFAPPGPICLVCHEEKHIEVAGMAQFHCTACHEYLAEDHDMLPTREGCLKCHEALTELGVNWPAEAPMQFPCGDCHQPHLQAKPVVDCLSCHPDVGSLEIHTVEAHSLSACQTCHRPHQWQVQGQEACLACHPQASPGATPAPPVEETPGPAGPPNIPHPLEGRSECTACHGPARFKPFPADHAGRASETCLACHRQQ